MSRYAITITFTREYRDGIEFREHYDVAQGGLYLIDSNDDLWVLIDQDTKYVVYTRLTKTYGDKEPK